MMLRLSETQLDAHQKFFEGCYVLRRNDRCWAGLSTYILIEQETMRNIKTHRGLTRGKWMTENQRLMSGSCPCQYVQAPMRRFKSLAMSLVKPSTSTMVLSHWERSVRSEDLTIYHCKWHDSSTKRQYWESNLGAKILQYMVGTSAKEFAFRKANQAVTLGSRSTVKIKCDPVDVDPQLLFQRLKTVREHCQDVMPLFQYELCTYPVTQ